LDKPLLISRLFWILFTLEAIGAGAIVYSALKDTKGWGPEGPVGAWIVFLFPILLAIPLAIVLIWPLVMTALSPIFDKLSRYRTERSMARQAAESPLVRALHARDAAAVKAALDAGANPNHDASGGSSPLIIAISTSPALTELLLKAGANPNRIDSSGRPDWWEVLYFDTPDAFATLTLLLDHGADLTKRDTNNGPVGWAAYQRNWRAVWLMIERGAAWKGENAMDEPVPRTLERDQENRRGSGQEVPPEMEKIRAKYAE
jgi:hypothetical protein